MAEGNKKISFGFSKFKKPNNLVKPVEIEKQEVEYVDSFDGAKGKFSYKGNVRDAPVKKDLVIPLLGTKTALEVIKARLEERKKAEALEEEKQNGNDVESSVKVNSDESKVVVKQEPEEIEVENKELSIEELAAKEILTEATGNHVEEEVSNTMVIPAKQESKPSFVGEKESTLEDYDDVPVTEYGLAMLRGMGWKPDPKKGKNQMDETIEPPKLRPKGLGLGADKAVAKPTDDGEELTIAVRSYVKFVSGHNFGKYGQVEALDGDTNRVVVKLALGGAIVSVSEVILVPVTKKDYEKNSKIINYAKYEKYKEMSANVKPEKEEKQSKSEREKSSSSRNSHRKEKYERSRERIKREESSGDDSDFEKYKNRHKSSSSKNRHYKSDNESSDEDRERKHKKKSTKDQSRSNSRERRHKKKKKKKYSSDSDSDRESRRRDHKKSSRR